MSYIAHVCDWAEESDELGQGSRSGDIDTNEEAASTSVRLGSLDAL